MKFYVFIMHMKPVKKNEKKIGGGQTNFFSVKKFLTPQKNDLAERKKIKLYMCQISMKSLQGFRNYSRLKFEI